MFINGFSVVCRVPAAHPKYNAQIIKKFFSLSTLCFGLCHSSALTMLGSLLLPFATGVLYGLMSLGKKADRGEMLETAASGNNYSQFENET
jgi:hypothetical protein